MGGSLFACACDQTKSLGDGGGGCAIVPVDVALVGRSEGGRC